jgi:hypothetical protein
MLRVSIKETTVRWEAVPSDFEKPGSRSLIAKLLLNEVSSACNALGSRNAIFENSFARQKDGRI